MFQNLRSFIILIAVVVLASCKAPKENTHDLKIVYNLLYDTLGGDYEIYTMNLDGTEQKNITNSIGTDWVYYTYEDKIFFISDRDTTARVFFLYEMDVNGENLRKISDLRLQDSWMSSRNDGKEMVVSGRIGNQIYQQLFLIDIETGNYTQLTKDTAATFTDPLFSPDGQTVFFRHRKDKRNLQREKAEIWSMKLDGSNQMNQLTHYPEADTTSEWHSYHAGPPRWHPTENFISYQSFQQKKYSLYGIDTLSKESRIIFQHDLFTGWHDWSPDGKWLVLDMFNGPQTEFDIYLVNWETKEVRQLTTKWELEQAPSFVVVKK